jgi:hypothetical protein
MTNILSDSELRDIARRHGGSFHGPNIEHLSIPEAAYFEMMRAHRKQVLLEAAEVANAHMLDDDFDYGTSAHLWDTVNDTAGAIRDELRRMAEGEKE